LYPQIIISTPVTIVNYGIDLELHTENAQIVGSEYAHLLNAIRWCHLNGQSEKLLLLVEGTCFYPYLVGLFGELREMLEAGLQAARAISDERCEMRFMYQLARTFRVQKNYEQTLERLDKAKEIALRCEDHIALGRAEQLRAHILNQQGNVLEGERVAKTVLGIGERLNNLELKVWASQKLAEVESKNQHFEEALQWLDQTEKWCLELEWSRQLAWITYDRASILIQQGSTSDSEPLLILSLNWAITCSDRRLIAGNKYHLALVYLETNRLEIAFDVADEARDLYERIGMTNELAEVEAFLQMLQGKDSVG